MTEQHVITNIGHLKIKINNEIDGKMCFMNMSLQSPQSKQLRDVRCKQQKNHRQMVHPAQKKVNSSKQNAGEN